MSFQWTTGLMLGVIEHAKTQAEVAEEYASALRNAPVDWTRVNQAIIQRWSVAGLKNIKRLAWREVQS